MNRCCLSLRRAVLALAGLILAGGSVKAQQNPPTTATPPAPFVSPAFNSPISPFLFGPPVYPFRATAPSSTTPAPSSAQISGVSPAPSLGSISAPPPSSSLANRPAYSQLSIGPFIASSLMGTDATSSLPGSDYRPPSDNRAHIWLRVPADAKVWFNGQTTTQTGTLRLYNSPVLTPGKKYQYEVRVRWMKDGKPIEEQRRIEVEAKDWLRFDLMDKSEPRP